MRARLTGGSPGPVSLIATSTPPGSASLVLISNARDRSLTSLIASMAFMIKFKITCCSWTLSPKTGGSPSDSCIFNKTPWSDIVARASPIISKIASLISKSSFRAVAFLEKSRIRLTISAARLPSLMIRPINGLAFSKFGG